MATVDSTRFTLNLPAMFEELDLLNTAADASFEDGQLATLEEAKELRTVILQGEEFLAKLRGIHARSVAFQRGQRS